MANQPPTARPFIRLPYFGRQPSQPQPPRRTPAARPPIVRGGFAQALRPNPPQLQPPPPPPVQLRPVITSPPPTTKSPMASPTPSPTSKTVNLPTPRESPKSAQSSAQSSPSPVMTTRSPSPISLPPSQLQSSNGEAEHRTLAEAHQKTAVDKQVIHSTTPKGSPVMKGFANTYGEHYGRKNKGGEGVMTMAGENKGAVMELGRGGKFTGNVGNGSELEEESDDEDNGRGRLRRMPRNAYVNSNVQGVNESILYNCSISHHDPGVHFSLPRNGYRNGNGIKHHGNGKRL